MKRFLMILMAAVMLLPSFVADHVEAAAKGKILVVASSENQMELADKSIMDVGFFLNEFAVPTQYLYSQGYEIVLATPAARCPIWTKAPMTRSSLEEAKKPEPAPKPL